MIHEIKQLKTPRGTWRSLPGILIHNEAENNQASPTRGHRELEQEPEEIELRRQQEQLRLQQQQQKQQHREQELQQQQRELELRLQQQQQQEPELRLKMQQQEDELPLRQHERALENERRKAEAEKEQSRLKIELTKGSSRASRSVADEIESVASRRNQERTAVWAEPVAQQSVPRRPLSSNFVIDPPTSVTQDRVDKSFSTYPKKNYLAVPTG